MIAVRGITSTASPGSASTASGTIPAGTQPGDLLVATVQIAASGGILAPPAGWTVITALNTTSNSSSSVRAAQRRAEAGDAGAAVEIGLGVSARWVLNIFAYYDDSGLPASVGQVVPSASGSQTASPATPAVTPLGVPAYAVAVIGGTVAASGVQPTLTAASGWTMQGQAVSTSVSLKNAVQGVATKALASPGEEPAAVHSLSESTIAVAAATIVLSSVNVPPVANAGPDQSVPPGATVILDGSGSTDPDGTLVGYLWEQVSGTPVELDDPTATQPTFGAPASVDGAVLVFSLTVTDDRGDSDPDTVTISVAATGSAKVWVAGAWQTHPIQLRVSDGWS
ncbi:PKD domain-containing protein [Polymorphospora lycopeni]|uniref:PKD domain-containing protein n=1 Tax=Polymorphospora lycopeni TaxID=3140240 RepID=A0ABV5CLJ3_9ACTN